MTTEPDQAIGSVLAQLRRSAGFTQVDLARTLSTSLRDVDDIESDGQDASFYIAQRIANLFGFNLSVTQLDEQDYLGTRAEPSRSVRRPSPLPPSGLDLKEALTEVAAEVARHDGVTGFEITAPYGVVADLEALLWGPLTPQSRHRDLPTFHGVPVILDDLVDVVALWGTDAESELELLLNVPLAPVHLDPSQQECFRTLIHDGVSHVEAVLAAEAL